jgi:PAS domain S-box-containing protein
MWQWKDDPGNIVPKISYVKEFKPWGWVIGTGIYIQDVKAELQKTKEHLKQISLLILLIVAFLSFYIIWQTHRIDIQRLKAEQAVINSEKRNRILIENAPEGIIVLNPETGAILDANPNAEILFGLSKERLCKTKLWTLSASDKRRDKFAKSELEKHVKDAFSGKTKIFEWTFFNKNKNSDFICEIRLVRLPFLDSDNVRGTVVDISKRKKAEEEIAHLRNYLSDIINSMPSVLIGVDKNLKVTNWNIKASVITGISQNEALNKPIDVVFKRLSGHIDTIRRSIERREQHVIEKQEYTEDGVKFYEDITVYPLNAGNGEGAVIRIDDVTQRVKLEETVIQSEKMLSVGGLAAGMAHEINNPLAGMILSATVLKRRLLQSNLLNSENAELLGIDVKDIIAFMEARDIPKLIENIIESGERAASIVKNMLDFARKTDLVMSPHSLADLVDKSIAITTGAFELDKKFNFADIKIKRDYQKDMPPVWCEAGKIQQVILNIISNGIDAIKNSENKPQEWEPEFIFKIYQKNERYATIEITDNGHGISAADRQHIFEPFYTTRPPGEGTGLGLSVSYFIITENHKGHMDMHSVYGEGTTFIIDLPLNTPV